VKENLLIPRWVFLKAHLPRQITVSRARVPKKFVCKASTKR